jgi:hypothetical protein
VKWINRGLIYKPVGDVSWAEHSALQPTPIVRDRRVVRVYAGFRDRGGVSRIGFVDLDAQDPCRVLSVSNEPVLDIGSPGMFDENGVVPCSIIERDNELYLYYAGYQLGQKVKFCVFGGLAISRNGGKSFQRYWRVPICDRTDREPYFRVIHSLISEKGAWRVWYGGGDSFSESGGKQLPEYDIRHAHSPDGITLSDEFTVCLETAGDEYRVGRPYVTKTTSGYQMFFCAGTARTGYRLAYADSVDGLSWIRKDEELGFNASGEQWDSNMQAYPSVIRLGAKTYMFYNGNDYGREGFGLAELADP